MKKYLEKNVYEMAKERMSFIFDEFENIYVSFSSGKDSGVMLNIAIDEARKRKRKIGVLFIDLEAFYQKSIEFVERMFNNNLDVLEPMWVCLPLEQPNGNSFLEPSWICWDKEKKEIWTRPMPENQWVINEDNNPIDIYKKNMTFENFVARFGTWYGKGKKTCCLIGIRADESLNRYCAVARDEKQSCYKNKNWTTCLNENVVNAYPIYDWTAEDDWIYNGKFNKDYNRLYDLFYKAGIPINKMRVDEPYGNESKAGLNQFRVIEPETWSKVVNRVSGANMGCIYQNSKLINTKHPLPKNHTWKSYTEFLLSTLPEATANRYRKIFKKYIKQWAEIGWAMTEAEIKELEESNLNVINTHTLTTRGNKDKEIVKILETYDELPMDSKREIPTWRRMAMCIIKNDICCKSIGFGITKDLMEKRKKTLEKYKGL